MLNKERQAETEVDSEQMPIAGSSAQMPQNPMLVAGLVGKSVSFDFDKTLSRLDVQEYAKELIAKGVDVWIVTSRYDELHKHRYPNNPTLNDLWEVADLVGIPRHKVRFTCMESKALYLLYTNIIWHLDDDIVELRDMQYQKCKTVGINVGSSNWKKKCNRLLFPKETIIKDFSNKAIWEYACRTILKDISQTFLSKSNQNKADKSSDKDVFQAVGETIKNFPIPEYRGLS
jgi:hypothetical protein